MGSFVTPVPSANSSVVTHDSLKLLSRCLRNGGCGSQDYRAYISAPPTVPPHPHGFTCAYRVHTHTYTHHTHTHHTPVSPPPGRGDGEAEGRPSVAAGVELRAVQERPGPITGAETQTRRSSYKKTEDTSEQQKMVSLFFPSPPPSPGRP